MDDERELQLVQFGDLERQQSAIVRRLDDGYLRIEQAIVTGEDVRAWEDFWITLLADYEALSDRLSTAA
jgi:hypothetical protein